jgi:hypothetical protein
MKSAAFAILLLCVASLGLGKLSGYNLVSGDPVTIDVAEQQPPPGLRRLAKTPGHWVPFSATSKRVFDPDRVMVGTFHRAADGSTRAETGPSIGDVTAIAIKNMPEKTFYVWLPKNGWESHPMELPPGGYVQPPPDTEINEAAKRVVEQIQGLAVIKARTDARGITEFQAPRLNLFAVKTEIPCDNGGTGCGLWYTDILIDEQPRELFRPPAGEPIVKRAEPGGIVRGHRGAACRCGSSAVNPADSATGAKVLIPGSVWSRRSAVHMLASDV